MSGSGSGSDGNGQCVMVDERKRKRMISNRESARRSRMKKQHQLETLLNQVGQLQIDNGQLSQKIAETSQIYGVVESENNVLRAQEMELTERLRSLTSILEIADEAGEFAMEPWLLPCQTQPIVAASDMYQW